MSNATAAGVFIAVSLVVIVAAVLIVRGYLRDGVVATAAADHVHLGRQRILSGRRALHCGRVQGDCSRVRIAVPCPTNSRSAISLNTVPPTETDAHQLRNVR